jgi:hypothetical protein
MTGIQILAAAVLGIAIAKGTETTRPTIATPTATRADLRELADLVEEEIGLPGFSDFAAAVAWRESRYNPQAKNTAPAEAAAAARGYDANGDRYAGSGFPRSRYTFGSGGWFGFLPSTALADREWNDADPFLIFDPAASVVLLGAFAQRIARNRFPALPPSARNWLTVRRFMAGNKIGLDWREELPNTARRRERLAEDYRAAGISPARMFTPIGSGTRRADPALYFEILNRGKGKTST